ncbi:MAG: hypothetical protein K6F07_03500 [Bacilli bacterium]|nr:hypothetical protein [Bacilli bacterium]
MKKTLYQSVLLIFSIVSILCAILGIVLSIIHLKNASSTQEEIFALVYGFFHLIICVFFMMMVIRTYKKDFVIYDVLSKKTDSEELSIVARTIAIIFLVLGLFLVVYSSLLISGLKIWLNQFPYALKMDLLNVGILLMIIMSFFILYPFVDRKKDK